ncbi:MAG: helix-turn-helix transcriptional regulator [Oscillospiraceae bacterium]|nr:helix-turn-helix transcriptional regulator [Oscillospiraceae bacterium]
MKPKITQNIFYVKKIFNVVKASHTRIRKPIVVKSRFYDVFSYTLAGECTYILEDGTEIHLKKDDILFLSHTQKYTFEVNSDEYKYIFCDFLLEDSTDCKSGFFRPTNVEYSDNLFRKLHKNFNSSSKASIAKAISVFYEIYALLMATDNPDYLSHSTRTKIHDMKAYMDLNFKNTSLTIAELASTVGMSEVYFRKLFKSQFGTSPSQYITSLRLNNAKELMLSTFMTLEDCALESGFSSLQYFCRVFKKATGLTPFNYRKQL